MIYINDTFTKKPYKYLYISICYKIGTSTAIPL